MRHLKFFLVFLIANAIHGQNLVPNSGFELYSSCPTGGGFAEINKLLNWYDLNRSSDYYNCSIGVPVNIFGSQFPRTGTGYIGSATNESVAVRLLQPLEANKNYLVEFYVSLAEGYSGLPLTGIGVHFSQDSLCIYSNTSNLQVVNTGGPLTDSVNWTKISGSYFAQGCEQYLALIISDSISSYYYFDDVSVICTSPSGCNVPNCDYLKDVLVPNVFTPNNDGKNDVFTIKFINAEPADFTCTIYNRWGNQVANVNYPSLTWDGTSEGHEVPDGVYYYILRTTRTACGEWISKRGFVQILRQ